MRQFRYISYMEAPPERQMAIDESILKSYDAGKVPPTLRFYRFQPSSITLGYTHDVDDVIDVEKCEELGIPFVRRITGGGTVYHHYEGEITYSIVTEKREGEIEETFYELLEPIIETLKDYGLKAEFKPYNDILVNKKKISGSAQKRGKRGLLQHGTIMFATDLETLSEILLIDEEKMKEKGADSFLDLVTTMERELGKKPRPGRLVEKLRDNYEEKFDIEPTESVLTDEEKSISEELEDKYSSDSWNYYREFEAE